MTKKMLSIASLTVLLALLVPLSVTTAASEVNCRVPFSFIVAGKSMSPGFYSLSTGHGYMVVKGLREQAIVLTIGSSERAAGKPRLVFLKTGDRYDLREVWGGDGNGLQVAPSKRRLTDVRAANAPVERVVIVANVAAESR